MWSEETLGMIAECYLKFFAFCFKLLGATSFFGGEHGQSWVTRATAEAPVAPYSSVASLAIELPFHASRPSPRLCESWPASFKPSPPSSLSLLRRPLSQTNSHAAFKTAQLLLLEPSWCCQAESGPLPSCLPQPPCHNTAHPPDPM